MPSQRGTAKEVENSGKGAGSLGTLESWETREYWVEYEDSSATSMDARNATGVPAWGAALPGYSLYVMEKSAERSGEGQYMWKVTVTYRTLKPNDRQPKLNATHSYWSIAKNLTSVPYEVPIQRDISGKVIANCLGEPYDPPVTQLNYEAKITANLLTSDTAYIATVVNTLGFLNSKAYTITVGGGPIFLASQSTLLEAITIADQYDQDGNKVGSVSLELHYRPGVLSGSNTDGWYEYRANLSYHKSAATNSLSLPAVLITDGSGQPVSDPQYLDATGQPIASGGSVTLNAFVVKGTANFDQIFLVGNTPNLLS